ncbi:MAG: formylglycine-generating enzyme family protein [Hyphomicrobiaceae bacterium]|nr:formylglycine-generating enzyme family protein [Hyphomicrobiaceae bacterium]
MGRKFRLLPLALAVFGATSLPAGAASETSPRAGSTFKDCASCPEMVVVPPGEFMMGSAETERGRSPNEGPQRKVTIAQAFAVGKVEVTFAQWDDCVKEGGCTVRPEDSGWGRGRRPVINVAWGDAKQYVAWLAKKTGKPYRLLSEAEWEYAARAQTKWNPAPPPFSTGATITYQQANYDANFSYGRPNGGIYRQKTVDTGTMPKNAFGLHEMHGNVWEWVEDCYRDSYARAPSDGSAVEERNCKLRILRGGSWNYQPVALRAAYRYATFPELRVNQAGFRVARSL